MIDRINHWLGRLCAIASGVTMVYMALIAFIDSIGRQLNRPLPGADEYVSFALLVFFFSSIPLMVRDDAHIRVGLFSDLYRPFVARLEKYFTAIVETLALCLLGWMIFDQADRLARFGTLSVYYEIPVAPWVYLAGGLCVIGVWYAIQGIWLVGRPQSNSVQVQSDEAN
jgi:TRAP-type C4-dicarboxylate transport system permease small subunit